MILYICFHSDQLQTGGGSQVGKSVTGELPESTKEELCHLQQENVSLKQKIATSIEAAKKR